MENPYHPLDSRWIAFQEHIWRSKMKKEIEKLFISQRRKNISLIFTMPTRTRTKQNAVELP